MLQNYPDSQSIWGYVTLCNKCKKALPPKTKYVDLTAPLTEQFPKVECEMCGAKG